MKQFRPVASIARLVLSVGGFLASSSPACASRELPLHQLKLPTGFSVSIYANVPGARSMTLSPSGVLYVGTRDEGKVYALIDREKENRADEVITIAKGLSTPNGVAFRDSALYVAEVNRVLRFDNIEKHLRNPPSRRW